MLLWNSRGSTGFTSTSTCVPQKLIVGILLVVANWSVTSCKKGNLLNYVEKVFEGKNSEHKKPSFLVTESYAFRFRNKL